MNVNSMSYLLKEQKNQLNMTYLKKIILLRYDIIRYSVKLLQKFCFVTSFLLLTAGCSDKANQGVQNMIGLNHKSPDEFTVISYPPLTTPQNLPKCHQLDGISQK